MNQVITLLSYLHLLMAGQYLYAYQLVSSTPQSNQDYTYDLRRRKRKILVIGYIREANIPSIFNSLVQHFLHGNSLQYRGKKLPPDLSGEDLREFDFTACHFDGTKLAGTKLDGAILKDTTCNYEAILAKSILTLGHKIDIRKQCFYSYKGLASSLQSIQKVYPHVDNTQKEKLLHLASDFAWLRFFSEKEFIKHDYAVSRLLELKLDMKMKGQAEWKNLELPLERAVRYEYEYFCWSTTYQRGEEDRDQVVLHTDFKQYIVNFATGLRKYCSASPSQECKVYIMYIITHIEGLKRVFALIRDRMQLLKEILEITQLLAMSYQYGGARLYIHYHACRNRLFELQGKLVGTAAARYILLL